MKHFYILFFLVFSISITKAQIINIPDPNFKSELLAAGYSTAIARDVNGMSIIIDVNQNGEIEVDEVLPVYQLQVNSEWINDLTGIKYFTNLRTLECSNNNLTSLDLTGLPNISTLKCSNNQLTNLNLTGLTTLSYLQFSYNSLETIDVSTLTHITYIYGGYNSLTSLDVSNLTFLEDLNVDNNNLASINLNGATNLETLIINQNQLNNLNINGLSKLRTLNASYNNLSTIDFTTATDLIFVYLQYNNLIELDLSNSNNIRNLDCYNNMISTLNVSHMSLLDDLDCNNNSLTELDVSGLTNLIMLNCYNNQLSNINLTGANNIYHLSCSNNLLTSINLEGLTNLWTFYIDNNNLTDINFETNTSLYEIRCSDNQLTTIDVSNAYVSDLNCSNNELESLFVKNGAKFNGNISELIISGNPNLQYVCADEDEISYLQYLFGNLNYTTEVNTYCSFVPGGDFYDIYGYSRYDFENNGCDGNDIPSKYLPFEITDGTTTGTFSTNSNGYFSVSAQAGTYTIMPVLENSDYFNVSPAVLTVNFPTDPSPFLQDFCITPNGEKLDLEIEIIPIIPARPGFQAVYKIFYHNKGNQTQSGEIRFQYYSNTSFISSIPTATSQSDNILIFNYTDLKPFETREINLKMNVNAPTDDPPVNNGDFLSYSATIYPLEDDETPLDNSFGLKQEVVGSFDPNDKTCLQGVSVGPENVGEYVHYLIRFENTGNYPAENIVVKDVIDTQKFDVSTLRALNGSHEFYTQINENVVEFIFENINLPFDDENNDGHVLFKIKTNPNLQLGDTFSNEAAIYFDYNFPIITNNFVTTIEEQLGITNLELSKEFMLFPNPSKNSLNILNNGIAKITSVEIYNILGQVVIAIPSENEIIDVSSLATGSYFVKIYTNNGSTFSKFIKE
jgi:Leucine-rich repeat (LRR) protein